MKKIGVFLLILFGAISFGQATSRNDVIDDISLCLRNANTKELSKHFSSTVSLSLLNDEGVYSKVQAEIILRDFFNRNQPTEVNISQRLDSNPDFRYIVLSMSTSKQSYRISYKLVSESNTFKITELRIE